jgi:hypothetical protein
MLSINLKEGYHLKDLGINVRVILKLGLKIGCEDVDWIHLAQDPNIWQVAMNTVTHFYVP